MSISRLSTKKTLLVTGGLGFIGSNFIDHCLANGHRIICYDKESYAAHTEHRDHLIASFPKQFTYRHVDIADLDALPECDIIVNFAAESHVDNSIQGSDVFIKSNVMGVHRILELLKKQRVDSIIGSLTGMHHGSGGFLMEHRTPPLLVQISTDEVFGDIMEGAFREEDRHCPSNPYAATKSAAEQLVVAWGRTYDLPYIITRTTNNYGPRQHAEKLIPKTITRLLAGERAMVHGDGSYVRNWIHVLDNVEALYLIIDRGTDQSYHISSDEEYSVQQIVQKVCNILGRDYDDSVDCSTDRMGVDKRYALDCSRTQALGWRPRRFFDESLRELIDAYRAKES